MIGECGLGIAGVAVCPGENGEARARAHELSRRLGLAVLPSPPDEGLYLAVDRRGLSLRSAGVAGTKPLYASFTDADVERRLRDGPRSALGRALGLHRRPRQSVFDATCGLGRDSAVLLGLGCEVRAAERHPVMQALLEDALARAAIDHPERLRTWQGLIRGDAAEWLKARPSPVADIVYMDPMFNAPARRALPKKPMQDLAVVVGYDSDVEALFDAARDKARRRVVVKRHTRAPELASPDTQVSARGARFDIYLTGIRD